MPRVHFVEKARKDNPAVKKGESYYWWKFRYGGKRYSRTRPRQSQLTQSAYFGTLYQIAEFVSDSNPEDWDDFETMKDDVVSQITDLRDETQSSLDNMPDSLQYSPTGELLQERIDALDSAESEIDGIYEYEFEDEDNEPEEADFETHEEFKEAKMEWLQKREDSWLEWLSDAKDTITEAIDQAIV